MAQLSNAKRLATEDFPEDYADLVAPLATALNPFLEQVNDAFNKNINFDNLNQEIVNVVVVVAADGKVTTVTRAKHSLKANPIGCICIRAENATNSNSYPTGAPFVTFVPETGNLINIKHITGLPANTKFKLSLLLIGN